MAQLLIADRDEPPHPAFILVHVVVRVLVGAQPGDNDKVPGYAPHKRLITSVLRNGFIRRNGNWEPEHKGERAPIAQVHMRVKNLSIQLRSEPLKLP